MAEKSDYDKIKEDYGEDFLKNFCRSRFQEIAEKGMLYKVLSDHFAPNKYLYEMIDGREEEMSDFIFNAYYAEMQKQAEQDLPIIEGGASPEELLDKAGYILYPECQTEEDVQSFKKYYSVNPENGLDEALCTFNGGRLKSARVWFAVKKDVDNIRREDFLNPQRQDEYGTSVLSIQFTRAESSRLSIKNRYNHTVEYPDATVEIVEITPFNEYILREIASGKNHSLILEFYNCPKVKIGDKITLSTVLFQKTWRNYAQPYAFEKSNYTKEFIKENNISYNDLIGLNNGNEKILLHRIYG